METISTVMSTHLTNKVALKAVVWDNMSHYEYNMILDSNTVQIPPGFQRTKKG